MTKLEQLARALSTGIGYDYDTLYADKGEWVDDRGARHDINVPFKSDIDDGIQVVLEELMEMERGTEQFLNHILEEGE